MLFSIFVDPYSKSIKFHINVKGTSWTHSAMQVDEHICAMSKKSSFTSYYVVELTLSAVIASVASDLLQLTSTSCNPTSKKKKKLSHPLQWTISSLLSLLSFSADKRPTVSFWCNFTTPLNANSPNKQGWDYSKMTRRTLFVISRGGNSVPASSLVAKRICLSEVPLAVSFKSLLTPEFLSGLDLQFHYEGPW